MSKIFYIWSTNQHTYMIQEQKDATISIWVERNGEMKVEDSEQNVVTQQV